MRFLHAPKEGLHCHPRHSVFPVFSCWLGRQGHGPVHNCPWPMWDRAPADAGVLCQEQGARRGGLGHETPGLGRGSRWICATRASVPNNFWSAISRVILDLLCVRHCLACTSPEKDPQPAPQGAWGICMVWEVQVLPRTRWGMLCHAAVCKQRSWASPSYTYRYTYMYAHIHVLAQKHLCLGHPRDSLSLCGCKMPRLVGGEWLAGGGTVSLPYNIGQWRPRWGEGCPQCSWKPKERLRLLGSKLQCYLFYPVTRHGP